MFRGSGFMGGEGGGLYDFIVNLYLSSLLQSTCILESNLVHCMEDQEK